MANSGNGRARLENILAAMAVGLVAVSVLSIIGLMLFSQTMDTSNFILIPYIGLPSAALMIIILLVMQISKKGKSN
jgi:tryptophan-rich sensory protein